MLHARLVDEAAGMPEEHGRLRAVLAGRVTGRALRLDGRRAARLHPVHGASEGPGSSAAMPALQCAVLAEAQQLRLTRGGTEGLRHRMQQASLTAASI